MSKKIKQKRIKNGGYVNSDTLEIRNLIFLIVGLVVLSVGLYFLTDRVMNKKTIDNSKIDIDYSECLIGNMLTRPYNDYYVFAYSKIDSNANNYNSLILENEKKDDAKKVYFIDLNNKFNENHISDKSNLKTDNISEIKIKSSALIHVVNGKITETYENMKDYEKVLK